MDKVQKIRNHYNSKNTDNPIVMLQNPVNMKMANTSNGSIVKVQPWMEIPVNCMVSHTHRKSSCSTPILLLRNV